jgi:CheY-like chemotaxis protein
MSQMMAVEAIKVIPALLWVAFAVLVYLTLRRAIVPQLGRLSSLKTPVVELSFAEQLLDKAAASSEASAPPSASQRRAAVSRLEHAAEILQDGRILWVDDQPEWNMPLVQLFQQLGMIVDTAVSTDEALRDLQRWSYDLVITDMRRDNEDPAGTAGIALIDAIHQRGFRLPVVVYAAAFDPQLGVHPGIFAYTNAVDDLVHYVIDLMERIKFGIAL